MSDTSTELTPNSYASATEGPHEVVSQTSYVNWTRPDGGSFIAAASNSETYARKGYKKGAEVEIEDLSAYLAEQAAKEPAKPAAATRGEHAEAPAKASKAD